MLPYYVLPFLADPLYYVGYLFAFGGTVGLLLFARGFFSGLGHFFRQDANAEHMDHYRARAIWGVLVMAYMFGIWECLRWIFTWFGIGSVNGTAMVVGILGLLALAWQLVKKPAAGGGH